MRTITTSSYTIVCIKNDVGLREFEVKFLDNSGVGITDKQLIDMCDRNNQGAFVTKYDDSHYVVTVYTD